MRVTDPGVRGLKRTFRKGAATMLAFTIAVSCFLTLFILSLTIIQQYYNVNRLETAVTQISRDIVVCGSLEEAREKAEREAGEFFADVPESSVSDVAVDVAIISGSQTWAKGNYIAVYLSAEVQGVWFAKYYKTARCMVMIEHNCQLP